MLFEFDFGTSLVCIRWFSMYITYTYKHICTIITMRIIIITTVSTTLIMVYVQIRYQRKYSDDLLGTTKRSFTVDDFARNTCHPRRILRAHIKDLNVSTILLSNNTILFEWQVSWHESVDEMNHLNESFIRLLRVTSFIRKTIAYSSLFDLSFILFLISIFLKKKKRSNFFLFP